MEKESFYGSTGWIGCQVKPVDHGCVARMKSRLARESQVSVMSGAVLLPENVGGTRTNQVASDETGEPTESACLHVTTFAASVNLAD